MSSQSLQRRGASFFLLSKNSSSSILWRAASCALVLSVLALSLSSSSLAQVNVVTQHNDNLRTGANTNETILTPTNVASSNFGKLFANPVDGRVYAQPLYVQGLPIPGKGTHNVVFVATEHDSIYAFDADTAGAPLWQITLLDAAHGAAAGATTVPSGDLSTSDIVPEIGITGTPVIDLSTNTMYVVGKSKEGTSTYVQRLHALDITTGAEKLGGPVTLSGSVSGTGNGSLNSVLMWDPKWEHNRPGLMLLNGVVYIGFGSHGDNGPWHGWILAYNASTLTQRAVYCPTPNGAGSGVWMSGNGLAADVIDPVNAPFGRLFIPTGNGSFNATTPYNNTMSYGDDHIRLDLTTPIPAPVTGSQNPSSFPQQLPVIDSFTPSNQASLNSADKDVASGGILLLPDQPGAHPHLLIQVGKEGKIYVINRDNMGGFNSTTDNALQEISAVNGLWASPAYWNSTVYFGGSSDNVKAFPITNGVLASTWSSRAPTGFPFPGASPSISANGNTNGIAWALDTSAYSTNGAAVLHAYDATNLATELFNSSTISTNAAGIATKFAVPTVANGRVYVGTGNELDVYGLGGASAPAATPVISPSSQTFTGTLSVTITDSTTGASIFYTTNGTTPTTASTPYTGAISVTSTTTVQAIATATGFTQSAVASQTYTLQTQAAAPTFTPPGGAYASAQSVTLASTTTGAKIYFTTDGTTPSPGIGTTQLYSAPVTVSLSSTLNAIATATNFTNSPVSSASYTIGSSGTGSNFVNGFAASASVMTFNGSTGLADTRLQLTDGGFNEASSAWFNTPLNIQAFTNDFTFQIANPIADGFTFTIQNAGLTALGPSGGGLGYGPDAPGSTPGIPTSVAIKFDIFDNAGEGPDSTGLYTNGVSPTTPAIDLTPTGVDLHSGNTFSVHMVYDGTTLKMTLTDGVTLATTTQSWTVNIPQIVGGNLAYVGFTGGSGTSSSSQKIETWTFTSQPPALPAAAAPTFTPAAGTYTNAQSVTVSDTTTGATIFYTLDGTTPNTSVGGSTFQYSGAINVSSSETIKALATAPNFSPSAVSSAAYVIQTQTAAPTFSPAPGTYVAAQSVTLSSTTTGALIFYTLDGTTPNTSVGGSTLQYTAPISIATTTTIKAIATASGFAASNVSSGTYTISAANGTINFASGFTTGSMILRGQASLSGTRLRVINGSVNEQSAAWFGTLTNVSAFTNDFSLQFTGGTNPTGDGFMFVIQNSGTTALGPVGGGLAYGPDNPGKTDPSAILKSVGIKFDLYDNNGEGPNSTGLYLNGASPTTPAVSLPANINLHTTDTFNVHMTYDGTTLAMTITDAVTAATFTTSWTVNIPGALGSSTGYLGFTGGTGGATVIADVISWTYAASGVTAQTATPAFSPAPGTYTSTQSVTLSDTTTGATIFYTLDGTTPNTTVGGSTLQYSTPISVSANTTITAVAIATGFSKSATASAAYVIQPPAAAPTFTPAAGTYTNAQSVTVSDTTTGATIFYTLDGTTPNTSVGGSTFQYSGAINVSSSETIKALATAPNFSPSAVSSAAYVINLPPAAAPTFSPVAGTYTAVQSVTLSDTTAGATIYYTTNGTTPTTASTVYTGAIAVNATTTIKAIATAPGFTQSSVASALYTINLPPTATPTFSPAAGTYTTTQSVTLSDATAGATIYYTTNGTAPTTSSTKYTTPISVSSNTTINAIALATGFSQSAVATAAYTITPPAATPTFSPAAGTYTTTQSVTLSDTTTGASIFFTTDGSTPTTASTKFTTPITVSSNTTIKAIATATGFSQSAVGSAAYVITPPAATPTFSPAPGPYSSAQNVTLSDATAGATIYYTTNGTTPTTASTVYSAPIPVSVNTTINAIATAPGSTQSAVASGFYSIGSTPSINLAGGFPGAPLGLKGSAAIVGNSLRLTNGGTGQAGAGWYGQAVNVSSFTTDFNFQITAGSATLSDGLAFVIQNTGITALGSEGGGLGYQGILKSVAVKFDIFNNSGEGNDSTGIYTNGAAPTTPAVDMTASGVDPKSTHVMKVHMVYDGTTLTMTITDATTNATFTTSWPINIATTVGASTAFVGFTGGTGGNTAIQDIQSWSFSSTAVKTPIIYETVNLPFVSSGPSFTRLQYSSFPDGFGTMFASTKAGDNVTLTLNVSAAGVYDVKIGEKTTTSRGMFQLSVNGTNVGPVSDEYSNTTGTFTTVDLGNVTITAPGPQAFKFTVTGKNVASTGFGIALDDITLTPQ